MRIFLLVGLLLLQTACSPFFVMRAAYEQGRILARRVPIEDALTDPNLSQNTKQKLRLVLKAREFSVHIGLESGGSFNSFSQLDADAAAWIVSASRQESFRPYTWWFPIVGSVPYKGYFSREDALKTAADLRSEGWECWTRPTAAFSTLGWFDDPLLSSTLSLPAIEVVNTVIHESVHSTVWIPGSVAFNESLANYIAHRAGIDFYSWLETQAYPELSKAEILAFKEQANKAFFSELIVADGLESLWQALERLYNSDLSLEDKLIKRQEIFNSQIADFKAKNPQTGFLKELNNAEIMQRRLYLRQLRDFDLSFRQANSSWPEFLSGIKAFKDNAEDGEDQNFVNFLQSKKLTAAESEPALDKEAVAR